MDDSPDSQPGKGFLLAGFAAGLLYCAAYVFYFVWHP